MIRKENQVLLGQRPESGSLAGAWEFPGGKIEIGESPEEALHRELNEELGINAEIGSLKFSITHQYGDVGILLLFFEVHYWKGEPKTKHHNEIKWVPISSLDDIHLPEANKKALDQIKAALR
ncbi:MAG: 8-oxo-dGTP diphosphatase MutT [Bdellovibrionales bacterium]|nr:8-oxo-dGTP diphosphatase MutT [Bdellovibrionales bacterium]